MSLFLPSQEVAEMSLHISAKFTQEMAFRQFTAGVPDSYIKAKAREVFGEQVTLRIANLASRIAIKDPHKEIPLARLEDGWFDPRFSHSLADYLRVSPETKELAKVLVLLSKDLAVWVEKKSEEVEELGLRLDSADRSIKLKCEPLKPTLTAR